MDVAALAGAGGDAADGADPGPDEAAVVDQALVAQRVESVDRDDVWQQAGEVVVGGDGRSSGSRAIGVR